VELPRSRDRKPDQHRGERCDEEGNDDADQAQRAVPIVTTTKPERHPSDDGDRCTEHRSDGADENVAILDVGQLMGEDSLQFTVFEHVENPGGHRHRSFLGAASGGERIRLRRIDDMNRGNGHVDLGRQLADNGVDLGLFDLGNRPRSTDGQSHLGREEIGEEVEAEGEDQRQRKAAAKCVHDEEQQRRHEGQKSDRLQVVHEGKGKKNLELSRRLADGEHPEVAKSTGMKKGFSLRFQGSKT